MTETPPLLRKPFVPEMLTLAALAVAILITFWNVPGNAFQLDDWHTIQENPWVRSLSNIPRYFADSKTFSTLQPNLDYRPMLQTSFAINYAMTGYIQGPGHPDSWHWTNITIHLMCSWCLFLLGRRLFGSLGVAPVPGLPPRTGDAVSFAAAFIFAIHPIVSGPVNYISARSSTLTAMFILPALIWYLRGLARPEHRSNFVISGILFAFAMLTKIEAISFLAAVVLAEILLNPRHQSLSLFRRAIQRGTTYRIAAFLCIGIAFLILWKLKSPLTNSTTRAGTDTRPLGYLLTQTRAWWYYIGQIFAPINLVADYPTYPLTDPDRFWQTHGRVVLLAITGWSLVLAFAAVTVRRVPVIAFLVVTFFAYLAPHSSIVPLAEAVNEHRPYLPDTAIFLLLAIGAGTLITFATRRPRLATLILVGALSIPLVLLTRDRNTVWRDAMSLWADNVTKTPDSTRVQMNYGLEFMKIGKYAEAESRFREAIRLAPNYHYAYTNLGITLAAKGDWAGAMAAHDAAVNSAPNSDGPYYWRGRFRAQLRFIIGAAEDFEKAVKLCSTPYRELAGAAECLLRLGKTAEAQAYIDRGHAIDKSAGAADFEAQRASMRALLGPADANSITIEADSLRNAGRWLEAEWRYREAIRIDPTNVANHVNVGIVLARQNNPVIAQQWFDYAVTMQPNSDMPLYWRGRFFASLARWDAALADFRSAQRLGPSLVRDSAAIIETLAAAGRAEEAAAEVAKVPAANAEAVSAARAEFKAQVFKGK